MPFGRHKKKSEEVTVGVELYAQLKTYANRKQKKAVSSIKKELVAELEFQYRLITPIIKLLEADEAQVKQHIVEALAYDSKSLERPRNSVIGNVLRKSDHFSGDIDTLVSDKDIDSIFDSNNNLALLVRYTCCEALVIARYKRNQALDSGMTVALKDIKNAYIQSLNTVTGSHYDGVFKAMVIENSRSFYCMAMDKLQEAAQNAAKQAKSRSEFMPAYIMYKDVRDVIRSAYTPEQKIFAILDKENSQEVSAKTAKRKTATEIEAEIAKLSEKKIAHKVAIFERKYQNNTVDYFNEKYQGLKPLANIKHTSEDSEKDKSSVRPVKIQVLEGVKEFDQHKTKTQPRTSGKAVQQIESVASRRRRFEKKATKEWVSTKGVGDIGRKNVLQKAKSFQQLIDKQASQSIELY